MTVSAASHIILPRRAGPAPRTTQQNPQQQLDQIPDQQNYDAMRAIVSAWRDVRLGPSLRAPPGTIGLFLHDRDVGGPAEAFLLATEFAHLHPLPDGSMHMVLAPDAHRAAVEYGWGIPHPMAGMPAVSPQTILIFAARDEAERTVVTGLIAASEAYARGKA
jgi:Family of unknown function (DUF5519)